MAKNEFIDRIEIPVRFSEVDAMNIVWHGSYIKYLEDGRESFGKKHGISYLDFLSHNVFVPLVKVDIDYKKSLQYGDHAIIETRYVDCEAAKIIYHYTIYNKSTNEIIATAKSIQIFMDKNRQLMLNNPPFFNKWKQKQGLL